MTQKDSNRTTSEIKAMMAEDGDFLRPIVRTVIQEFMEAEMAEAIGAQKFDPLTVVSTCAHQFGRQLAYFQATHAQSFGYFSCQRSNQLKSTNMLERINQELKRRTHVIRIFPNDEPRPALSHIY